jgi:hypothetical protein
VLSWIYNYAFAWCLKYIFIPLGVTVLARIIAGKVLKPQPERQRKNGLLITVLNNKSTFKLTATSVAVLID